MPDAFFLVEEQREAGQVSHPVQACKLSFGDLSKPIKPAYFFGVKLMFVIVIFFGHVQLLRFVVVRIFRSCSILNLVIFWSCVLASILSGLI